jgi:hypothetical protein
MLKRIQFIELQDLAQMPSLLRDGVTDYLQFILSLFKIYDPAVSILKKLSDQTQSSQIYDLCSGSGGPLVNLSNKLPMLKISLSDLYPNTASWQFIKNNNSNINYIAHSVNAVEFNFDNNSIVTMFTSFHHFNDHNAQKIINNCVDTKSSICIFEFVQRDWRSLLLVLPSPIFMFFLTPFVSPFKISRIIFTYLLPLIPIITLWDITVTVLRIRKKSELLELTKDIKNYDFKYGEVKTNLFLKMSYFYGVPLNE